MQSSKQMLCTNLTFHITIQLRVSGSFLDGEDADKYDGAYPPTVPPITPPTNDLIKPDFHRPKQEYN